MRRERLSERTIRLLGLLASMIVWQLSLEFHAAESSPMFSPSHSTDAWRSLSRNARIALEHDRYDVAESLYLLALTKAQREKCDAQSICDLKINLAETYRRDAKPETAERILDEIRATVLSASKDDPMLPARYWRRCYAVQSTMGDLSSAAQSLENAFAIVRKHFPPGSKHYLSCLDTLVIAQGTSRQPERLLRSLLNVKADLKGRTLEFNHVCKTIASRCCDTALATVQRGELDLSAQILELTSKLFPSSQKVFQSWSGWVAKCVELKETGKLQHCEESVSLLIDRARRRNLHSLEIGGHLCLFDLHYKQKQEDAAQLELDQVTKTLERLRNDPGLDPQYVLQVAETPSKMIVDFLKGFHSELSLEENLILTDLACKWSMLPPRAVPRKHFASLHCSSRLLLAQLFITAGEPTKAKATLDSLSKQTIELAKCEREIAKLQNQITRIGPTSRAGRFTHASAGG